MAELATWRPRNTALERELTALAARARSIHGTLGLDDFADARALPGGVRSDLNPSQEAAEELADCRNYLVWGVERVYDRVLAGDPDALDEYERLMRALGCVVAAHVALHTEAA